MTDTDTGILVLGGTNTYTGTTTISGGGTLGVAADRNLGTAPLSATPASLTLNGGTLDILSSFVLNANRGISLGISSGTINLTTSTTLAYSGIVADGGGLTVEGGTSSILVLGGVNTYGGGTTISGGGTLEIAADSGLGADPGSPTTGYLVLDGGTLATTASFTLGANRGISLVGSGGTFDVAVATTLTYAGIAAGAGPLTKIDSGILILGGSNTSYGGTTVSAGTLQDGTANALLTTATLTVNGTGTFDLNGVAQTVGGLADGGVPTGTVTDSGPVANFDVNDTVANSFSGMMGGALSLTKGGAGTLTLSHINDYSGITTINGGTLSIATDANLGTAPASATTGSLVLNGGTLATTANVTLNSDRGISLGASGGTFDVANATSLTYNGIAAGAGTLTKTDSGTMILGGVNNYSGGTTVVAGILKDGIANTLPAATTLTVSGTGTFDLNGFAQTVAGLADGGVTTGIVTDSGAAATFTVNNSAADIFTGLIGGSLSLTQSGAGTLTLGKADSYSGATTISGAGTLKDGIANALPTSTTLTVGGTGTFDLNGFAQTVGGLADGGVSTGTVTDGGVAATFTVNDASANSFSGLIGGALSLTKTGAGTLTLVQASTYTGTTTISAGTIQDGIANALPAATSLTVSGTGIFDLNGFAQTVAGLADGGVATGIVTDSGAAATFTVNDAAASSFSGQIGGALSLTKTGAGTLILSYADTYSGTTTIGAGTVQDGIAGALPASTTLTTQGTGTFDLGGFAQIVGGLVGTGTVTDSGAAATLTVNDALDNSFSGTITDGANALSLIKTGVGTLTLSQPNSYTGSTTINGGTLSISADGSLGTAPGSPTLGSLVLNGGTLATTAGFTLDSNRGISLGTSGGTFDVAGLTTLTYDGIAAGVGALTKLDDGTLVLGGANVYTSGTTVVAGTIIDGIVNALPTTTTLTVNGAGTFDLHGFAQTVAGLADDGLGTSTLTDSGGAATLIVNDALPSSFSGTITNGASPLSLIKTGASTLTLSQANTYTGTTTINGGTLSISADANLGTAPASATAGSLVLDGGTLAATASLTLNSHRGISLGASGGTFLVTGSLTTLTYNGIVANSGSLTDIGTGTLVLGGDNAYTGSTTISGGTLSVSADHNLGTAPASPTSGSLTLDGGTLATTATFALGINRGISLEHPAGPSTSRAAPP